MQIDIDCESLYYPVDHLKRHEQIFRPMHLARYVVQVLYFLHNIVLHQPTIALPCPGHLR